MQAKLKLKQGLVLLVMWILKGTTRSTRVQSCTQCFPPDPLEEDNAKKFIGTTVSSPKLGPKTQISDESRLCGTQVPGARCEGGVGLGER